MTDFLIKTLETGNATAIAIAIFGCLVVYLIIFYQRKNTEVAREKEIHDLKTQLLELQTAKQLMEKDIENVKVEQEGIIEDIKEIKQTLQQMALSLERIATKYDTIIKTMPT